MKTMQPALESRLDVNNQIRLFNLGQRNPDLPARLDFQIEPALRSIQNHSPEDASVPSIRVRVRTFAFFPLKRRKSASFTSGRSSPGEETSKV